jgi:hypothetical protein
VIGLPKMAEARFSQEYTVVFLVVPGTDQTDIVAGDQLIGLAHGGMGFVGVAAFGQGHELVDSDHHLIPVVQFLTAMQAIMQGAVGTGGGRIGSQQCTGLPEAVAMVAFGCGLQSFVSHLMGHFVEQHILEIIPATVVDDIPAQGNFPFGWAPAAQSARHIANGKDGLLNRLPKRFGQQPEGIFPFCQQAAQDLAVKERTELSRILCCGRIIP